MSNDTGSTLLSSFLMDGEGGEKLDDASTDCTDSVTAGSSTVLHRNQSVHLLPEDDAHEDPFAYTPVTTPRTPEHEDEGGQEDASAVERVWFSSVSDRFQRFCISEREVRNSLNSFVLPEGFDTENDNDDSNNKEGEYFAALGDNFQHFCDAQNKKVTIDLEKNESFDDPTPLTLDEMEQYWYVEEELETFRENAAIAYEALFVQSPERVETYSDVYEVCCTGLKKKTDQPTIARHRRRLAELYMHVDKLLGLEHMILTFIRGDPSSLRQFVLQHTSSCVRLEEQAAVERARRHKSLLMQHVSQCVTQPSQHMACEIARAVTVAAAASDGAS